MRETNSESGYWFLCFEEKMTHKTLKEEQRIIRMKTKGSDTAIAN